MAPWLRRGWAIYIDDQWPLPDNRQDDLLRHIERIHVPVDQAGRHVEQPALRDLGPILTTGAEFKPGGTLDNVAQDIALAVVMPAGHGTRFGPGPHERRTVQLERDLPDQAGARRRRAQLIVPEG